MIRRVVIRSGSSSEPRVSECETDVQGVESARLFQAPTRLQPPLTSKTFMVINFCRQKFLTSKKFDLKRV